MPPLPLLETPRTVLTVLHPDNAALLFAYQQENKRHLAPWEPERDSQFHTAAACHARAEAAYRAYLDGHAVNFIAIDKVANTMVAGCNFTNIVRGPLQACNLGYSIAREYEGRGLMQEVAAAGIRHVFEVVGLHRIMANHMPANVRSERLLGRLGFEREGYARAYLKIAGKWEDMVLNALINPQG